MAAICPGCGQEYDATLFQFDRVVVCDCGRVLRGPEHTIELGRRPGAGAASGPGRPAQVPSSRPPPGSPSGQRAGRRAGRDPSDERTLLMEELKRKAERLCVLILRSDYPEVDIAIERARLREWCEQVFPDRMDLYDMIYESRFDRLLEQFGQDRRP